MNRIARLLFSLTLISCCTTSDATVVYRIKGELGNRLKVHGGVLGYSAPVEINGAAGSVEFFGFDEAPNTLMKKVGKSIGLEQPGIATVKEGRKTLKVLVSPAGKNMTNIFVISTDGTPPAPPALPPVEEMPHYPQSKITLTMVDHRTNAALCISEIDGVNPDQVRFTLDSQLHSAGWSPALPGASYSLGMYFKDNKTCLVYVAPPGKPGEATRITVLHKRQGVE